MTTQPDGYVDPGDMVPGFAGEETVNVSSRATKQQPIRPYGRPKGMRAALGSKLPRMDLANSVMQARVTTGQFIMTMVLRFVLGGTIALFIGVNYFIVKFAGWSQLRDITTHIVVWPLLLVAIELLLVNLALALNERYSGNWKSYAFTGIVFLMVVGGMYVWLNMSDVQRQSTVWLFSLAMVVIGPVVVLHLKEVAAKADKKASERISQIQGDLEEKQAAAAEDRERAAALLEQAGTTLTGVTRQTSSISVALSLAQTMASDIDKYVNDKVTENTKKVVEEYAHRARILEGEAAAHQQQVEQQANARVSAEVMRIHGDLIQALADAQREIQMLRDGQTSMPHQTQDDANGSSQESPRSSTGPTIPTHRPTPTTIPGQVIGG